MALLRRLGGARHYAFTFLTEFAGLASGLLVLKLAAIYWGTEGFGEYVLARRVTAMVQLPLLLGMGLALTRFVARTYQFSRDRADELFFAGTVVTLLSTIAAVGIMNIFAEPLARLFLGRGTLAPLVHAMSVAVGGLVLHSLAYSGHRGRLAMKSANALQAWNMAMVPPALFAIPHLSATQFIFLLGAAWTIVAGAMVVRMLKPSAVAGRSVSGLWETARPMLAYGVSRVPGDLAFGALFALPVTIAAHRVGLEGAGFVGLGVALLSMAGSLFAPLGQILLPAVSTLELSGSPKALEHDVMRLVYLCVLAAAIPALLIAVIAKPLLANSLGSAFTGATGAVRLAAIGALPYIVYVVLRNVLDALEIRPVNSQNLLIAVGVFILVSLAGTSGTAIMAAFATSTTVLGLLTYLHARRTLGRLGAAP